MQTSKRRLLVLSLLATAALLVLAGAAPTASPEGHAGAISTLSVSVTEGACTTPAANGTLCLNAVTPTGTPASVKEWVYVNNGTTLYSLPAQVSGASGTTVAVSVANATTEVINPVSTIVFRAKNLQVLNGGTGGTSPTVPSAPAQNTVAANSTTNLYVDVSSGSTKAYYLYAEYAWTNYTRFQFSAPKVQASENVTLRYTVLAGKKTWLNTSVTFTGSDVAAFLVMAGLTANFSVPTSFSTTSCGTLFSGISNGACSTTTYTFTGYTVASMYSKLSVVTEIGGTTQPALAVGTAILPTQFNVTAPGSTNGYAWVNLTVGYTNSTTQNTLGGFYTAGGDAITTYFVNLWYVWLLVVVVIVTAVVVSHRKPRRRED